MDRNLYYGDDLTYSDGVALRKESVDRNTQRRDFKALGLLVALRKESVDRNSGTAWVQEFLKLSLSARRAWIEIFS